MSIVPNHRPKRLDQAEAAPRFISAAESLGYHSGVVEFWIEHFYRNGCGGRMLVGPFIDRRNAVQRAAQVLAETDYGREVAGLTIVAYVKGGGQ